MPTSMTRRTRRTRTHKFTPSRRKEGRSQTREAGKSKTIRHGTVNHCCGSNAAANGVDVQIWVRQLPSRLRRGFAPPVCQPATSVLHQLLPRCSESHVQLLLVTCPLLHQIHVRLVVDKGKICCQAYGSSQAAAPVLCPPLNSRLGWILNLLPLLIEHSGDELVGPLAWVRGPWSIKAAGKTS